MKIIITGGAGFIGSNLISYIMNNTDYHVMNIDSLTYAGNLESLNHLNSNKKYNFIEADINDEISLRRIFNSFKPNIVMHLAAESHVDRSISNPKIFLETNVIGTFKLLEESRNYFHNLDEEGKKSFLFHHISTDEVYGDLHGKDSFFTEKTSYSPSSPYSASKASSDHLVRAWGRTYGLPIIVTNCSNNYGYYQFPEKLIPHMILNAINDKPLPVYGNGLQIRDWLFAEDHARALIDVISKGSIGETYNIGGHNEKTNIEVVKAICDLLDELAPKENSYHELITYVDDRPGHDLRYAIDAKKIKEELGWVPHESFESGLRKTIQWYLNNLTWCNNVLSGEYKLDRVID
tara:strand:- start:1229 stop:2275 length:1047 start_codon:yes stop_codon:yes gene_type:complete